MRRPFACISGRAPLALLLPLLLTPAGCSDADETPEFVPLDRSGDRDAGADGRHGSSGAGRKARDKDSTSDADDDSSGDTDDDGNGDDPSTAAGNDEDARGDDDGPADDTDDDGPADDTDDDGPADDADDDGPRGADDDGPSEADDEGTSDEPEVEPDSSPEPDTDGSGGRDGMSPSTGGTASGTHGGGGCSACSGAPGNEPESQPEPTMLPGGGGVECGNDRCASDEVCCSVGPCSGLCVIDCRPMQWCPDDLVCNADTGVCDPREPGPAPTGSGPGPAPTGSGPGPAPTGSGPGPAPTGSGPGPAPTGSGPGPAPTATGPGGGGPPNVQGDVPDCSMIGELGAIDTKGPSVPAEDSLEANFNVDLNDCTVRQEVLECNESVNEKHLYQETVQGGSRKLTSNAIPNHEVGEFPHPGQNPHAILPQDLIYDVPLTPSGAGEPLRVVFGVATSGIVFEPQTAEYFNDGEWLYEALRFDTAASYDAADASQHPGALGLDCNFAHVQSAGKYHYHGVPTALLPDEPALTFVGWAADGYPIFAVWGPTATDDAASPVRVMLPSYRVIGGGAQPRPEGAPPGNYDGTFVQDWEYVEGLGDLDECNGRTAEVVVDGQPVTTYHYVLTHAFPYIPRCFKATPDASFEPKTAR